MASNGRNQPRHAHTLDGYSSRRTPDVYSSRPAPDAYSSRHTLGGYSNRHALDSSRRQKPQQPEYWATLDPSAGLTYRSYGDYSEIVYTPPNMCYVIVTIRSLLWTFMTIIASVTVVASIITPQWLVGDARLAGLRSQNASYAVDINRLHRPTLGIFNRCTKVNIRGDGLVDHCATFVTGFEQSSDEFPNLWKSSLIFFTIAVALLGFTNVTAVFSLCIQSIFRKSIFTVSGLLQAIAGLFLIVGEMLYPAGWASQRVRNVCGERAGPFFIDDCSLGWAFYTMLGGTLLVFVSAVLSMQAETATSSDQVEKQVMEGKTVICVAG